MLRANDNDNSKVNNYDNDSNTDNHNICNNNNKNNDNNGNDNSGIDERSSHTTDRAFPAFL